MIKDKSLEGREMTAQEKELYKCHEYEEWLMSGGAKGQTTSSKGNKKAEKGIKIVVKSK